ncbi:MAG: sugar phosphate isomerase/epimerase [Ruminococcaceae bacterium]|nr:sugar phosphate isomerase/epimerase [Oscillospiraceae bacterium]
MAEQIMRSFGLSVQLGQLNDEFFAACRKSGVYSVEISLRPDQYPTLDWDALADMTHKNGIVINSVHLPFSRTLSISHPEKENRDKSMELNCSIMRKAAAHGVPIAVIHPSTEPNEEEDRPRIMQYAKDNLKILAELAAELSMAVAVEDLPRTCLGRNSADMLELLSADSRLRACFDTNHLLSQPIADCVRAIGDKIVTLHVSDYDFIDERHLLPGELDIDWAQFMDLLDEIGYTGVFTYEVSGGAENKYIRRKADLTPEDYRRNYDSLVKREKPVIPAGEIIYR